MEKWGICFWNIHDVHPDDVEGYVKNKLPRLYMNRDIIYDISIEELLETYNNWLNIYKQAEQMKKGLLIIFLRKNQFISGC